MRTLPQYWLYGLLIPKEYSKGVCRKCALDYTEHNFFGKATTGGKHAAIAFDKNPEHYSMVECGAGQLMKIVNEMMKSGFDLSNLDEVFNAAPLPEFRTTLLCGRRKVEIIFTRPEALLKNAFYGGSVDCSLDVYFSYSRSKRNIVRVSRFAMHGSSGVPMYGLYSEPMNPGKNINYYQDFGIRLYTIYLAIQYALLCSNDSLCVTNTRYRYIMTQPSAKEKYHRIMLHDFALAKTSFSSPVLARNLSKGFKRCRRLLSKQNWEKRHIANLNDIL